MMNMMMIITIVFVLNMMMIKIGLMIIRMVIKIACCFGDHADDPQTCFDDCDDADDH